MILGLKTPFTLYFSLFSANLTWETGSISTASATRQSEACGDFPPARKQRRIGRVVVLALGL